MKEDMACARQNRATRVKLARHDSQIYRRIDRFRIKSFAKRPSVCLPLKEIRRDRGLKGFLSFVVTKSYFRHAGVVVHALPRNSTGSASTTVKNGTT